MHTGWLLLGLLFAVRSLAAELPRLTLDWRAPAGCPTREAVLARVEQLLGDRGNAGNGAPLDVRELVTLTLDGRFRAELGTLQAGTERSRMLEAATCSEIAEASAVVIALAVSPGAALAEPPVSMPPLESQPVNEPVAAPPPLTAARDEGAFSRRRSTLDEQALRPHFGAGLVADLGAIAPLAPGLGVSAGLRYGRYLDLGVRAAFFPERTATLASQPNQGVRLFLVDLAPTLCAEPFELPVELGACVLFDVGYLGARGFGPPFHYARSTWWLAPGAGLTAAYPARARFRSRLNADVLVPLSRTEFVLTNAGVVRQLPPVAPRLGLALELAFP